MADLATMLHSPHSHVRTAAGLAHRARELLKRERVSKKTAVDRAIYSGEAIAASAALAAADHYLGGADEEMMLGPVPVGLGMGFLLSGISLFGGDDGWADHVAAVGDALIAAGTYGFVKSLLKSQAGG